MAQRTSLRVNGRARTVEAEAGTPLLYVLREEIGLNAPHFGCGLGQCGACTVHIDGKPVRSCVTPATAAAGKEIVTLAGLGTADKPHPVQQAYVDEQVPQCGYCVSGWIMTAAAFLEETSNPSDEQIRDALSGLKCRCGTHLAIIRAIKRAAKTMAQGSAA
jgi:nicotinate dehydrogenase subunit A